MPTKLWVETYRPDTIDGYVFQSKKNEELVRKWIAEKSIPHLLLGGVKGTGKTTLALILIKELGIVAGDTKIINASDENSIDVIRNKIKEFSQVMPIGDMKIVFLDEADYLSPNAQGALRRIMEEYSDTVRFILTCNHLHKISDAIKSRCVELIFTGFNKDDMVIHAFKILKKENIQIKTEEDAELLNQFVDEYHPDMRKLISSLEANVIDGELCDYIEVSGLDVVLVDITKQLSAGNWMDVREGIISSVDDSEWEEVYRLLYENIDQVDGFSQNSLAWKQAIVIIADHLRHHFAVADSEINFSACMIKLSGLIKK